MAVLGAACAAVTVTAVVSSSLRFGYQERNAHVALETCAALIAVLALFLVIGRLKRSARLDDLLLACGLAVVAATNFGFRALPAVIGAADDRFVVWSAVGGRVLAAALLAVAAFAPSVKLEAFSRTVSAAAAATFGLILLIAAAAFVAQSHLPFPPAAPIASAGRPNLDAHPAWLAVQVLVGSLYVLATLGFARRAERGGDALMRWLAFACLVSVFSRVNYFLYPSAYTDWVSLGDIFRLAFFLLLLVGALREIASYWQTIEATAVLEERRRIARDLHDGLAQELLFIAGKAREVAAAPAPQRGAADALASAAERALHESRRAIAALTKPLGEPLDVVLAQAADDVAARADVTVHRRLVPGVHVDSRTSETLARIVSEAVTNAARHGHAHGVVLELENHDGLVLRIADDGHGFDPARRMRRDAFGLISMRERVAALGGKLRVDSVPGLGTTVSVEIPG